MGQLMPVSLAIFSLGGFAMIGLPLTTGFIAKLYLGIAVLEFQDYFYLIVLLFSSLLNLIYYLPIITNGFLQIPKSGYTRPRLDKIPLTMLVPLIIVGLLIIAIGVLPNPLTNLIDMAVASLIK